MPANCPHCHADTSQSSGIVCPQCGFILEQGADDPAFEGQVPPPRRDLRYGLAFFIPFVVGFGCIFYSGAGVAGGLICGAVLGTLFLICFALASTRISGVLSQAFGGLFLFLGLIAVVAGVVFFGCSYIFH